MQVFSSFATRSCSWQFVIVLAMLEFEFIAFKQRARLCFSWKNYMHGKRKVDIAGHEVPWRPRCAIFARFAELAETAKNPHMHGS